MEGMSDPKIKVVEGIYDAFGRGDIDAILAVVTDDVNWASEPESTIAPWHGVHKGKGELPSFFIEIGKNLEVTEFTQLSYTSNDTDVMVVSRFGMKVPATGKSGSMDLHHWFRFENGKVAFYRGTEDTALTKELLTP
jgi:ketosteroid isomerase-like protein